MHESRSQVFCLWLHFGCLLKYTNKWPCFAIKGTINWFYSLMALSTAIKRHQRHRSRSKMVGATSSVAICWYFTFAIVFVTATVLSILFYIDGIDEIFGSTSCSHMALSSSSTMWNPVVTVHSIIKEKYTYICINLDLPLLSLFSFTFSNIWVASCLLLWFHGISHIEVAGLGGNLLSRLAYRMFFLLKKKKTLQMLVNGQIWNWEKIYLKWFAMSPVCKIDQPSNSAKHKLLCSCSCI